MIFAPMLAEPVTVLPSGPEWRYEPKYDGVRCLALLTPERTRLLTRSGIDMGKQFPEVVQFLAGLRSAVGADVVLDGELAAATSDGFAGFRDLQHRLGVEDAFRISLLARRTPAVLVVFDLLVLGSRPLLSEPLADRRRRLEALVAERCGAHLRLGDHSADGLGMLERAHAQGWEGVIAKRCDSPYLSGRHPTWTKYKPTLRQEFVIGGFTESDRRDYLRAIVVGYHEAGRLVHAGDVGSGFSRRTLAEAYDLLHPAVRSICPFSRLPETTGPVHWVEPGLVVEVRFQDWTPDGKMRFPRFLGFRHDKPAAEVVRET